MKKYVEAASGTSTITLKELCSGQDFLDKILDMLWDDPVSFGFTYLGNYDHVWIEYGAIKGNDVVGLDLDGQIFVFKDGAKYATEILIGDDETYERIFKDHPELEPEIFDTVEGKSYGKDALEYLLS